ncbi:MAG TPA: sel1 repeat family protein [Gammaproteobacteria bacterium]|nr:sel1 repeat family protein [Gammaproteobacteria bacterium]
MDQDPPELQEAVAAISRGDFSRSYAIVSRLAHEDVAMAQHFLGWHYHKGIGTGQNDRLAVSWWQRAAAHGLAEAQQGLGWAYANGRGVEADLAEAYRWYNRAVAGGDEEARQGLLETAGKLSSEQLQRLEREARDQD